MVESSEFLFEPAVIRQDFGDGAEQDRVVYGFSGGSQHHITRLRSC